MQENKCKMWERQRGESIKAFEAFALYRDMGPKRSIRAVGQELGKSNTLVERWSSKWNWVERAREYDKSLDELAQAAAVQERKSMAERHISAALKLQEKALKALESLSPQSMSPKDIRESIKLATDLERLCRFAKVELEEPTQDNQSALAIYLPEQEPYQ